MKHVHAAKKIINNPAVVATRMHASVQSSVLVAIVVPILIAVNDPENLRPCSEVFYFLLNSAKPLSLDEFCGSKYGR